MNEQENLKIQAYLDNELSESEARQVRDWLEQDGGARTRFEELQWTKSALAGNELEIKLPEHREFYWSRIKARIDSARPGTEGNSPILRSIRMRWFAPLAAATALGAVLFFAISRFAPSTPADASSFLEVESSLAEASVFTFHSKEAGMTVVWISTSTGK